MKKTIWDINYGDEYYHIYGNGYIECEIWHDSVSDHAIRNAFGAFLTREEAKAEVEVRRKKALASRPKPFLTEKEMRYLSAVIEPFRDRVQYIDKRGSDKAYIRIFSK